MPAASATMPTVSAEFVGRLAVRAQEAEGLRRLPSATMDDLVASNFTELPVPARYGGSQADFPAILDPARRLAHGCASSAWTIGFFALHNWMLALFDEQAQAEAFATRPFLAPAPLAARIRRDVDVLAGHVVFDYDTGRELAGASILGMKVPRTAMV